MFFKLCNALEKCEINLKFLKLNRLLNAHTDRNLKNDAESMMIYLKWNKHQEGIGSICYRKVGMKT